MSENKFCLQMKLSGKLNEFLCFYLRTCQSFVAIKFQKHNMGFHFHEIISALLKSIEVQAENGIMIGRWVVVRAEKVKHSSKR